MRLSPAADPETSLVLCLGQDVGEVRTVDELGQALAPHATVPASVRQRLEGDRMNDLLRLKT